MTFLQVISRGAKRAIGLLFIAGLAACSGDKVAGPDAAGTGGLSVLFDGIPSGASAALQLTRSDRTISPNASGMFDAVPAGTWTLVAGPITIGGLEYRAEPASQPVIIGKSATASVRLNYVLVTGSLAVTVSGLPAGLVPQITVSGPGGFSRALIGPETMLGLTPGRYRVSSARVNSQTGSFDPAKASQDVDVAGNGNASAVVAFGASPASIGVDVSGLPNGVDGAVNLTAPGGTLTTIARSLRFDSGEAGRWRLAAALVRTGGFSYVPAPASVDSAVLAGDSLRFAVRYSLATGAIAVAVTGLPAGSSAQVAISGPGGYARTVTGTTTITDLQPGTYTLVSSVVTVDGTTFRAASSTRQVSVEPSLVATAAAFSYAPLTATLAVSVSGAPGGASNMVRVTGPNAFDRQLSESTVLDGLVPGTYTVVASAVEQGGATWRAGSPSVQRTIAGDARDSVAVQYSLVTGSIAIAVGGLPAGVDGVMRLSGPNDYSLGVTNTTTITGLAPGTYTLDATNVTYNGFAYVATPRTQSITVEASLTAAPANVTYGANNATLVVTMAGAPVGAAQVQVTGPAGYTRNISTNSTLVGLAAGTYTVTATGVLFAGTSYLPAPTSAQRTLASGGRDSVGIVYTGSTPAAFGTLSVTVTGLPNGTLAAIQLTGPSTSRAITGSTSISGLAVGSYSLNVSSVVVGGVTYNPTPSSTSVAITANATSAIGIAYSTSAPPPPVGDDLSVDFAYVTQAIQRPDGTVPLVSGRAALLRVFVRNNRGNTLKPDVRARIYDGGTLLQTITIAAPENSVRTALDEGTMLSTWNTVISAANVRPALRVLVDVDPTSSVSESDRSNNQWPRSGTPQAITVNDVPVFNVRFVPVTVGALTGNVTAGNMGSFLSQSRMVHPINTVSSDVRAAFVSSAAELQSTDANGAWLTVLSELNTLRVIDGAPSTMHYYGVVKVAYSSGVAGYGYVPGRTAMGWDYLPSGNSVAAHEFGHNFNRSHSPCGVFGDPAFPYAGGTIGYYGWNSTSNTIVSTGVTDFMGYCNPTWTSDWTWQNVMTYRGSSGFAGASIAAGASASGEGLLVWGRIANGRVMLEPALRVNSAPTPRVASSVFHLEALDADGRALLDLPIDAQLVDHVTTHEERQFAVVVPWSATLDASLASLRVRDVRTPLSAATRTSETAVRVRGTPAATRIDGALADPASTVERGASRDRLRWDAGRYPLAVVRDAATGQTLAFLRRSGDGFVSRGRAVTLTYSDGVRSVTRQQ